MSTKPLQLSSIDRDNLAAQISNIWFTYNSQRQPKIEQWKELRNYIFATDTTTTTNKSLPWKNSTTLPKLCQIRDNLHSNYLSALFPNDEWLKWEGYSKSDGIKTKVNTITAYMANKARESHFRREVSKLIYDYIDYGNAFAMPEFEASYAINTRNEKTPRYIGPKAIRISPLDIVFNPLSSSFKDSWKIIRSVITVGELARKLQDNPEDGYLKDAINKRTQLLKKAGQYGIENSDKADGFQIDGFGNFYDYLQSGYVEMLTFYGDIHNADTGEFETDQIITIIDRCWVISQRKFDNWFGAAPIYHVGWRSRPDNLWSMGPLDNLVGMQYRIDHLENLKADAMDLAIMPPLVIKGEVEQFQWGPGVEIHLDENGDVQELAKGAQWVVQADNNIDRLEMRMEQYAGAPREAMGIRSPGEKTAFEIRELQNAAGRIFQEKLNTFELELLEPLLNGMLELGRRNMDQSDWIRVLDDDLGVTQFMEITKEDITASGKLRPIGARHFAAQAQMIQNLTQISNTPIWQQIAPHTSTLQIAKMVEDLLGFSRYQVFRPNVGVTEGGDTARLQNQVSEDIMVENSVPQQ